MAPPGVNGTRYRRGVSAPIACTLWHGPLGPTGLVSRGGALFAIRLQADPGRFAEEVERAYGSTGSEDRAALAGAIGQLEEYVAGSRLAFDLPIDLDQGTPFQQRVWRALLEIPYGTTVSYAAVARRIASPGGVRAVGKANGANPLPIVVPCHRVVAAGGKVGGFSAGLELKRRLLDLETGVTLARSQHGLFEPATGTW